VANRRYIELDFGTERLALTPTDLVQKFVSAHTNPTALWIPSGIRGVVKDYYPSGHSLKPVYFVVTEQPPAVRNLSVNGVRYSVSLPYLINIFTLKPIDFENHPESIPGVELNRIWAFSFFRKMPLRGLDDPLLLCNLPNVESKPWNENMKVYPRQSAMEFNEEDVNVAINFATTLVDYYLTSDFDLKSETSSSFHDTAEVIPQVSSFERWEEESLQNPQLAYELDWLPHPEDATLRDVLTALRTATHCVRPQHEWSGDGTGLMTPNGRVPKRRLLAMLKTPHNAWRWY
jgi:hypothetical protein